MGDSAPNIDLDETIPVDEEFSDISGVFNPPSELPFARWTLAQSEDTEAPEVICELLIPDEELARLQARSSRAVGHGLRPIREGDPTEVSVEPSVVVTIYL